MGQTVCLLRTQTITSSSFQVTVWRESYRTAARRARRYVTAFADARRFEDPQQGKVGDLQTSGSTTREKCKQCGVRAKSLVRRSLDHGCSREVQAIKNEKI